MDDELVSKLRSVNKERLKEMEEAEDYCSGGGEVDVNHINVPVLLEINKELRKRIKELEGQLAKLIDRLAEQ